MNYRQLDDGRAKGQFGAADNLGTLNWQTPEAIQHASTLVRAGRMFPLNAPLNWPDPPLLGRGRIQHTIFVTKRGNRDDYYDSFYPQASTQWDGLGHVKDPETGYYNGLPESELGIEAWAKRGIAGRAVLLDVERSAKDRNQPLDWRTSNEIDVADLEAVVITHGIEKRLGDVLLVRTGWAAGYQGASAATKAQLADTPVCPGLACSEAMAEYLWDWGVSAVASDNFSVEATPGGSPSLHVRLLARLGIPLGELFWLEELAADSAVDGRYESLLVSAPLNVPGGVGSPANAIALK